MFSANAHLKRTDEVANVCPNNASKEDVDDVLPKFLNTQHGHAQRIPQKPKSTQNGQHIFVRCKGDSFESS
jgi:hypothetical protein